MGDFVLDLASNPHPALLAGAIQARRTARAIGGKESTFYWVGFMDAMVAATGRPAEELNAWIDHHTGETSEDVSYAAVSVRLTQKPPRGAH